MRCHRRWRRSGRANTCMYRAGIEWREQPTWEEVVLLGWEGSRDIEGSSNNSGEGCDEVSKEVEEIWKGSTCVYRAEIELREQPTWEGEVVVLGWEAVRAMNSEIEGLSNKSVEVCGAWKEVAEEGVQWSRELALISASPAVPVVMTEVHQTY